jgi:hypothetical protein
MGVLPSTNVSPFLASRIVWPITVPMALADLRGTALPMPSRQRWSLPPASTNRSPCSAGPPAAKYSSGSMKLCSAASSSVVNGRCQVPSSDWMRATSLSAGAGSASIAGAKPEAGRGSATLQGPLSWHAEALTAPAESP